MNLHNTLFLILSQKRLFWLVRGVLIRFGFLGHRQYFFSKHRAQEFGLNTWSWLKITTNSVFDLLIGISVAAAMQLANPLLAPVFSEHGITVPDENEYGTLLGTIVGVGGVFIGLYYTSTTAIAGTVYAHVPDNVRQLLVQERDGNVYFRFVARVTFLGIVLLALRTAGFPVPVLALPVFVFFGGVSVIAFVKLGSGAFNLFNPTSLAGRVFIDLRNSCEHIAAGTYLWSDPSFQHAGHRSARQRIDTLLAVESLSKDAEHLNGRPYAGLCMNVLSFLIWYSPMKKRIPTESLWYSRIYKHPDWYKTDDSITSMIHQSGTALPPKEEGNLAWIEEEFLPIVFRCIGINLSLNRMGVVTDIMRHLNTYVAQFSSEHEVASALKIVDDVYDVCREFLFSDIENGKEENHLQQIAIADTIASIPISILLAYVSSIEDLNRARIYSTIREVNWNTERGIYNTTLPSYVLPTLQWFFPRINIEKRATGNRISPDWYVVELIAQVICERTQSVMSGLINEVHTRFESWQEDADVQGSTWLIASFISREEEYDHKLSAHFQKLANLWSDLYDERRIKSLKWPKVDFDELAQRKDQRRKDVLKKTAREAVSLSAITRPDSYPDFAGQFLHTTAEALINALYENDRELVNQLFGPFLEATVFQFDRLKNHP